MNDVMMSSWPKAEATADPPLEAVNLRDLVRAHAEAIRKRVLRAVEHHEGELANVIVLVTSTADYVTELGAFARYGARAGKVDAAKFEAQLRALVRGAGDRVVVAQPKAAGEGWTFSTVVVPRLELSGLGR